jgi:spoIIIJ-associated protein
MDTQNSEVIPEETTDVYEEERDKVLVEAAEEQAVSSEENEIDNDSNLEEDEGEPELSDEELDHIADTAIETLRGLLAYFSAEDVSVDEYEGDEGELILDVVGDNLAVLIGRHGRTLDSLQYLVSSIVNKKIGFRYPITIDIEGYKHRRRQKLESLARSSAARAIRNRADVRLRPMTPFERRIIHIVLREDRRIETVSEGEEPNRQIVIKVR